MRYSVTILNDASLIDWEGVVHTWLRINGRGVDAVYFSFSNNDKLSTMGIDSPGKSSVNKALKKRQPTEEHSIKINKQQYDALIKESQDFYTREPKPNYDLTPDNEGDYNCVTASRTILQFVGIYYLDGIQTPFGVKYKIRSDQSTHILENVLNAKDDFDSSARELIECFVYLASVGFDSKDIVTKMHFDRRHPIVIPYGRKNSEYGDFYLNYGDGISRLHDAARFGHLAIVKYLVNIEKIDVFIENANGATPLHYAARFGHLDVIKYFIDNKHADFNIKNKKQSTPLHYATLGGHLDVAKYLIGKSIDRRIDWNISDDIDGATPLHYAASSCNFKLVKHLIAKGADVNVRAYENNTPLHYAVSAGGSLEIVKYLIDNGAIVDIKSNGTPTIHFAALGGHLDILQYLIVTKHVEYDIKSNGVHTLHYAVRGGSIAVVEYLIKEKNVDVNVSDNVDDTPLHDAACRGYLDIVQYLLRKGANKHTKNKQNETPLDCANKRHQSKVVKCLTSVVSACISQPRHRRSTKLEYLSEEVEIPYNKNIFTPKHLAEDYLIPAIGNEANNLNSSVLIKDWNVDLVGNGILADFLIRLHTGAKYQPSTFAMSTNAIVKEKLKESEDLFNQTMRSFEKNTNNN